MHEIDAVLIAARAHGFLTIDVSVEELARVVHQCRRSAEVARKANRRAAIATQAKRRGLGSSRTRFRA